MLVETFPWRSQNCILLKVSECRKFRTVPKTLHLILIHCRIYSLPSYIDNHSAQYLSTLSQVVSQSESCKSTRLESSANQNRTRKTQDESSANQNRAKISPSFVRGWKTLLGSRLAIAYVKTWRVFHPTPDQLAHILLM